MSDEQRVSVVELAAWCEHQAAHLRFNATTARYKNRMKLEASAERFSRIAQILREQIGEPRELLCMICNREYPTWYAPNPLWNRFIRKPDGSDIWQFLCPTCFGNIAAAGGASLPLILAESEYVERLEAASAQEHAKCLTT